MHINKASLTCLIVTVFAGLTGLLLSAGRELAGEW